MAKSYNSPFTEQEVKELELEYAMLTSSKNIDVRNLANRIKGQYRTVQHFVWCCYPFQNEYGRPTKKYRDPKTGEQVWMAYKKLSAFGSANALIRKCVFFVIDNNFKPVVVEVHPDGEPGDKKASTIPLLTKPERYTKVEESYSLIQDVFEDLQSVRDDEEEAFNNLPEGLQDSERGETMQDAIDSLDDILGDVEDAMNSLEEAVQNLETFLGVKQLPWETIQLQDKVIHKNFGEGSIIELNENNCVVGFGQKRVRFPLPDAIADHTLNLQ
jgi:hypothetical protein